MYLVFEVLQMPSVTCSPRWCRCYYCSTDTDQYIFSVTFPQGSRQQTLDWPLFACSGSHQLQFRGRGARHWAVRPGPGNLWPYKADLNGCPLSCVLGEAHVTALCASCGLAAGIYGRSIIHWLAALIKRGESRDITGYISHWFWNVLYAVFPIVMHSYFHC